MTAAKREAPVPELMGNAEVAAELGILASNLGKVARLPAPVQELKQGRVWRADTIRAFAQERRER